MLYAGCCSCRTIVPLWCAGLFMPHPPAMVHQLPAGAACPMCGPLPPVFTCTYCWTQQWLAIPGGPTPAPSMMPGAPQFAPVAQAPPNSGEGVVAGLLKVAATSFAKQCGAELASGLGGWLMEGERC